MCGPLSSAEKKRLFFRRRGAVATTSLTRFITFICCILALCLGAAAIAPAYSAPGPAHASWIPGPVSGFLSSTWALTVVIAACFIALAKLMSVFLARRAAHAKWSSSCLPTTWRPKNGTSFAYQRLDTDSFISSSGTKQSSSSEPADCAVYITIEAPTCPDMMKQQQPNTDSTTDSEASTDNTPPPAAAAAAAAPSDNSSDSINGAAASSGLSSLNREQPLQLIIQLQQPVQLNIQLQDNGSASTAASQAATIAALTWKVTSLTSQVDTLQEQLSMISTGRVKAISAQFNACRQQAALQD
uniref:Uncharacterized protein n=1 Tax=Tetradesmus obliquus TaxID=3088 RepID=A0A383VP08_TETOB|eukprot:jgi/Sobl393_1/8539/SZX66559.1